MNSRGFTFIEVLVAMLIFVLAVIAAINIATGSVRATKDARDMTVATWLLQNVMVELETKVETEGFDKGCEKKKEAKFEAPYDNYRWATFCDQIDFNISKTAAAMASKKDDDSSSDDNKSNAIQKMILDTASDYLSKSIRELHAEVSWTQGKTKRSIDVTTHIARYDQPLVLPGLPGAGGTGTPTPAPTPAPGGGGVQ